MMCMGGNGQMFLDALQEALNTFGGSLDTKGSGTPLNDIQKSALADFLTTFFYNNENLDYSKLRKLASAIYKTLERPDQQSAGPEELKVFGAFGAALKKAGIQFGDRMVTLFDYVKSCRGENGTNEYKYTTGLSQLADVSKGVGVLQTSGIKLKLMAIVQYFNKFSAGISANALRCCTKRGVISISGPIGEDSTTTTPYYFECKPDNWPDTPVQPAASPYYGYSGYY